ncbi:hypothetical protein J6590_068995 [Homalodisca vitripennis]|nr:hypothetical protein J6590_068995 [Homalodisca vitripennis]
MCRITTLCLIHKVLAPGEPWYLLGNHGIYWGTTVSTGEPRYLDKSLQYRGEVAEHSTRQDGKLQFLKLLTFRHKSLDNGFLFSKRPRVYLRLERTEVVYSCFEVNSIDQ